MAGFKPGDEVCLRSGSLPKTVEKVDETGVHCLRELNKKTIREVYLPGALELAADQLAEIKASVLPTMSRNPNRSPYRRSDAKKRA
jgi:hypothetical protein